MVWPDDAGIGVVAQRCANDGSDLKRSMFSSAATSNAAVCCVP